MNSAASLRATATPPLSRRTAERLRDAVERVFPQLELVNPNELPKRWRLPAGAANGLATVTTEELAVLNLTTAIALFHCYGAKTCRNRRRHGTGYLEMRPLLKRPTMMRIEPDLEALTEAEGLAMRPGPRRKSMSMWSAREGPQKDAQAINGSPPLPTKTNPRPVRTGRHAGQRPRVA